MRRYDVPEPWHEAVVRSLITLKALTYRYTGGIVAAPTTSLPEQLGGSRNWDYRYCWLRDSTFTLWALYITGHKEEAAAWREWLLRAVAGEPRKIRIMYGIAGERWLPELDVPWLAGYENSAPVRIGNAAHQQFQLDVFGEVMDTLYAAHKQLGGDGETWNLQQVLMEYLEGAWRQPDDGIWEVRGPRRHFTHSKTMAWVAADRAVRCIERFGCEGPVERWKALREEIRADVLKNGYNEKRKAFVQSYGSEHLDASVLMMPMVGFIQASDPRMASPIAAIERELLAINRQYGPFALPDPKHLGPVLIAWAVALVVMVAFLERNRLANLTGVYKSAVSALQIADIERLSITIDLCVIARN